MARISVIGAGNMGGAFAEALSKRKDISLCIYDSCRPCAEKIAGTKANVTVLDSMDQARGSDVVVIAVKPQVLPQIYDQLSALKPGFFISTEILRLLSNPSLPRKCPYIPDHRRERIELPQPAGELPAVGIMNPDQAVCLLRQNKIMAGVGKHARSQA